MPPIRRRSRTLVLPDGVRRQIRLDGAPRRQERDALLAHGPANPAGNRQQREASEEQQRFEAISELREFAARLRDQARSEEEAEDRDGEEGV